MTIASVGYGGDVDYSDWATLMSRQFSPYGVAGAEDFQVSAGPGDREVLILPGAAGGHGILDVSNGIESVLAAPVASGSRWDTLVLRRDWESEQTTPVLIQGGPEKAIAAGRLTGPGVRDDQPIALCRFSAAQTVMQESGDLRVWQGAGGAFARSSGVLDYLTDIGTQVQIGGVTWARVLNAAGAPVWARGAALDSGWVILTSFAAGWSAAAGHQPRLRVQGDRVEIFGAVSRTNAGGINLLTIPGPYRPKDQAFIGAGVNSRGNAYELYLAPTGQLSIPIGYATATFPHNIAVPLTGFWYLD